MFKNENYRAKKIFAVSLLAFVVFTTLFFTTGSAFEMFRKPLCYTNDLAEVETFTPIASSEKKTAFLTFDDGPSRLTAQYLEVLKENDVTATFFVVTAGANEKYFPVLSEMSKNGNLIAIHSDTHQFRKIYKNSRNFWEDVKKEEEKLSDIGVVAPKIFRFPGGSTNTVSRKFGGADIMTRLKVEAGEKGYQYVDWNASAEDASGKKISADTVFTNVIKDAKKNTTAVILMHDTASSKSTLQALPRIIKWLKINGYEIKTIDKLEKQI